MTDTIRDIIEAAMPEKDLLDGFTGKGGLYLNNDEYGRFIATFDPEHALLMEAVVGHWWNRRPDLGTYCNCCHASAHYNNGIADIPHRDDCPVPALLAYRREHGYTE